MTFDADSESDPAGAGATIAAALQGRSPTLGKVGQIQPPEWTKQVHLNRCTRADCASQPGDEREQDRDDDDRREDDERQQPAAAAGEVVGR